ncbi:hypothetical protein RJT34_10325 [Clitoria ternatea]|uniref:C2 NT-type domain-containing protein n=1 Tax=Clitoria ternatea TaxID=43366 RepID=A0AAN9K7W4_CLITE
MTKIKCWATRLSGEPKEHAVKLTQLKLQLGLFGARVGAPNDKVVIEITGLAGKSSKPKRRCSHTTAPRRFLTSLAWDARDLSGFHLLFKDVFHMAFHAERGGGQLLGKVEITVPVHDLLLHRTLPIQLSLNGLFIQATLSVSMKLLKVRDCDDDDSLENRVESEKKRGIIGKMKYLTGLGKKNNDKFDESEQVSPYDSDGSPVFDSDDLSNESTTSSGSSKSGEIHNAGSHQRFTSSNTKTHLDTVQRSWSRNTSFNTPTVKQETQTTYHGPSKKSDELSLQLYHKGGAKSWGVKEISSRDGQGKLKTNVFFASFDQRSEQASGESACTVLVALIAHWLHSNHDMPTRSQFDSLIRQGSSEWRRLCNSDCYSKLFPDKHFDLETIIEANLRPLVVLPQKSYTGFFSPEKFRCLKGAMSFDEIWDEIKSQVVTNHDPRIYIVSWNDHFFVLKMEADAYYIIDSLGERLFEGCKRAFILKFDDSSVMYGNTEKTKMVPSKGNVNVAKSAKSDEGFEVVCRGKECCKEFIKRFLAAIPLWQLEKEEKKWSASSPYLHRQLQIDFHYSYSSSLSVSATSSLWSHLASEPLEA